MTTSGRSIVANVSVPILAPLDSEPLMSRAQVQPSIARVVTLVTARGELLSWPSPCGANCSYTFSFVGPAYQCLDLGPLSSTQINITELFATDPTETPSYMDSSVWYDGVDDSGDEAGTPVSIWIFYNSVNNILRCTLYNATYTTNISYINNTQYVHNNLELLHSITVQSQLDKAPNTSIPTGSIQSINLWSLHEYLCLVLTGWIGTTKIDGKDTLQIASMVSTWAGVANWSSNNITFPDNLASKVQDLMVNFTISLIDLRNYPIESSVMRELNFSSQPIIQTLVPATITSYPAVYAYSRVALWQIYATALGFTLICVMLGSFMLYTNGVAGEMSFSQVLVTTRNPTLDRISEGAGRGGKYITDRVQKVKVRYGRLNGAEFGFGTEDDKFKVP